MTDFELYFRMGLDHITDRNGYDHMLFLVTLCATFPPRAWRRVLLLATAFTLGHSVTLAMTALGWRIIEAETVEILIPITIFLTALFNLFRPEGTSKSAKASYGLALAFGLIHGMGFAGFFSEMLTGIREDIILPLLYFNIGLEIGQLIIVGIFMGLALLALGLIRIPFKTWSRSVSVLGGLLSLWLLYAVLS